MRHIGHAALGFSSFHYSYLRAGSLVNPRSDKCKVDKFAKVCVRIDNGETVTILPYDFLQRLGEEL